MQSQSSNNVSTTMIICVNSYNQGIPSGHFCPYAQEGKGYEFYSLVQLIVGIENVLNSASFPQSFTVARSFFATPESEIVSRKGPSILRGERATFMVKILFRQHTSWQGTITWLENKSEQAFRSVLELILLMDSALNSTEKD